MLECFVWLQGNWIPGRNPDQWRQDDYGRWMFFDAYGDRSSIWGWEIDHIKPKAEGGSDKLDNLRPLNWMSNVLRNRTVTTFGAFTDPAPLWPQSPLGTTTFAELTGLKRRAR